MLEEFWAIVNTEGRWQIVTINASRFPSDQEAAAFVLRRAREGSEIHSYALEICKPLLEDIHLYDGDPS